MDVGLLLIFQNYMGRGRDEDVVKGHMRLAEIAEPLGFDKVWPVEHHFTDYAACPDNIQFLSWVAARTSKLRLGTGAVIVPWNDPLRVAERITLLDHLSGGRAVLGLGRGLARREYAGFGIDMGESRERFDEASRMIIEALDKGFIEGDGRYYPQIRTEIRPRPRAGFRDRFYCVGMSPESVVQAADLGGRLMVFSQQPWELFKDGPLAEYRKAYRERPGSEPPPPLTGDLMFCHEDAGHAEELARKYMAEYFLTIIDHYELMSDHFKHVEGYDHYRSAVDVFQHVGLDRSLESYVNVQTWGTPERIVERLRARRELLGEYELDLIPWYGSMPFEEAEASVSLFAREALPALRHG